MSYVHTKGSRLMVMIYDFGNSCTKKYTNRFAISWRKVPLLALWTFIGGTVCSRLLPLTIMTWLLFAEQFRGDMEKAFDTCA